VLISPESRRALGLSESEVAERKVGM
jgi:hypothetical protein